MIFDFDFASTCVRSASRQQLNNILKAIKPGARAANSRSALLRLIETHSFDPMKGFYVPVAPDLYLKGKLPIYSERLGPTDFPNEAFPHCYFTNGLLIPNGYGSEGFDVDAALEPKHRATNIGFQVVTIEYDCTTSEQLEQCLAWTRSGNGEGDFSKSPFATADRELSKFKEYRGYCIVFTGNRSLHLHLIFSTKHLENAPWDLAAEERLTQSHADLLTQAHQTYWDTAVQIFDSILHSSLTPDPSTRILTQWRRSPWALRELEKDSVVLGLPIRTAVPQLVIHENIRSRATRNSEEFLVAPEFKPTHSSPAKSRSRKISRIQIDDPELLKRLEDCCRDEWGDYPKPAAVRDDRGDWVINFWNHAHDKNPSTLVKGSYGRLIINGTNSFTQDFYLPDHLSANDLCESLIGGAEQDHVNAPSPLPCLPRLKSVGRMAKWVHSHIDRIHDLFAKPVTEQAPDKTITEYRQRLQLSINEARIFGKDLLTRSPEGIGKTSGLFEEIALEIFDAALSRDPDQHEQFGCFAFRSTEQAEFKAEEYRQSGQYRKAVVLRSFWDHYRRACASEQSEPFQQHEFPDHSVHGILHHIKSKQPSVFERLEERRGSLWIGPNGKSVFDSAMTVLFTNHDLAKTWYRSHITRIWHHPEFQPLVNQDYEAMRTDLTVSQIVFDEPEIDKLLHVIPESLFNWLDRTNRRHSGWTSKRRSERYNIYRAERDAGEIPGNCSFEETDELMRLRLDHLEAQEVNYEAMPFGYDQLGTGIYSSQNGKRFYLGVQDWLKGCKARLTFLTTEALVSDALTRIFDGEISTRDLIVLDLNTACDLFPIEVPLVTDNRAAADWSGKPKITALAGEILGENPNAILIANGVEDSHPRIKTFQRAKGLNGLNDSDIYVIVTCISPGQYAELNVVAGWLEMPDVIQRFYEDQISQAVGRNTGFRKSKKPTKTILISSNRLAKNVLNECFQENSTRVRLRRVTKKAW